MPCQETVWDDKTWNDQDDEFERGLNEEGTWLIILQQSDAMYVCHSSAAADDDDTK